MSLPWVCPCQAFGMKDCIPMIIIGSRGFGKNGFSLEGRKGLPILHERRSTAARGTSRQAVPAAATPTPLDSQGFQTAQLCH